jgi:SAM-dependent methyltransferase
MVSTATAPSARPGADPDALNLTLLKGSDKKRDLRTRGALVRSAAGLFAMAAEHHDDDPFHHLVAGHLVAGLPRHLGVVLDVATGTGTAVLEARRRLVPTRLPALDISADMPAVAERKDPQGTVEWIQAPAVPAPLPDHSADTIIRSSAAHLIGSALFAEWRRLLTPTGRIAFTVPSDETFRPSAAFTPALPIPRTTAEAAAPAEGFATAESVEFHTTTDRKRTAFLVRASDFRL